MAAPFPSVDIASVEVGARVMVVFPEELNARLSEEYEQAKKALEEAKEANNGGLEELQASVEAAKPVDSVFLGSAIYKSEDGKTVRVHFTDASLHFGADQSEGAKYEDIEAGEMVFMVCETSGMTIAKKGADVQQYLSACKTLVERQKQGKADERRNKALAITMNQMIEGSKCVSDEVISDVLHKVTSETTFAEKEKEVSVMGTKSANVRIISGYFSGQAQKPKAAEEEENKQPPPSDQQQILNLLKGFDDRLRKIETGQALQAARTSSQHSPSQPPSAPKTADILSMPPDGKCAWYLGGMLPGLKDDPDPLAQTMSKKNMELAKAMVVNNSVRMLSALKGQEGGATNGGKTAKERFVEVVGESIDNLVYEATRDPKIDPGKIRQGGGVEIQLCAYGTTTRAASIHMDEITNDMSDEEARKHVRDEALPFVLPAATQLQHRCHLPLVLLVATPVAT